MMDRLTSIVIMKNFPYCIQWGFSSVKQLMKITGPRTTFIEAKIAEPSIEINRKISEGLINHARKCEIKLDLIHTEELKLR